MNWVNSTDIALYIAMGAALGAVYFALLALSVRLHVSGAAAIRIVPMYVARLAIGVSVFWAIARLGALALLLALLGFLMARIAAQRWMTPE